MEYHPIEASASLAGSVRPIAAKYNKANHYLIRQLNRFARQVGPITDLLPSHTRKAAENAMARALVSVYRAAASSQKSVSLQRFTSGSDRALVAVSGAVGGLGGIATTIPELPFTIGVIFRAMQRVAAQYGRDIHSEATRQICLSIFLNGSVLSGDKESEKGFIGIRVILHDQVVQTFVARAAHGTISVLGPKFLTPPVLGAISGTALNLIYIKYYRELAHVYFQLAKLAAKFGAEAVIAEFVRQIDESRTFSGRTGRLTRGTGIGALLDRRKP